MRLSMRALQRLLLFVYLGNGFELLSQAGGQKEAEKGAAAASCGTQYWTRPGAHALFMPVLNTNE
jgi:hypothetical protein